IPANGLPYPWETCMTMGNSWSYVPNDVYKPADEIIEKLVDVVSKGGNYLLNIGPGPDGELDPNAYQRLKEIGTWIKVNGEAIYGSRSYSSLSEGESIRYTQSKDGKTQYIFFFNYPEAAQVLTKIQFAKNAKLQLLGSKSKLVWKQKENGVEINLPAALKTVTAYVWVLKVSS
ncbi:MAG: alpha-L-fucosidase, partial [Ferruginibacter sp.]